MIKPKTMESMTNQQIHVKHVSNSNLKLDFEDTCFVTNFLFN